MGFLSALKSKKDTSEGNSRSGRATRKKAKTKTEGQHDGINLSDQSASQINSNFVLSEETKPEGIDFVVPSLIKETLPDDLTFEGTKVNDYFVEIGATN
ncbi:hypothetical protein, partial [Acinetobacter baumannii]